MKKRKWPEERIPIDLEPIQGFNLRAQVVGHGGAYVKHIQQETRCRVQIKGRNSGFIEHGTNQESDEPMYLHVAGPDPNEVQHAKELCESLLDNVREQYQRFKENPPQQRGYGYQQGGGDRQGGYGSGYGGYGSYGGAQSPSASATPATPGPPGASSPTDYAAQYAQYYGGQDPYAAYGGYQNYVAYYQYYQQQAAQQGGSSAAPGASAPPPPPADDAPPPPPSGSPPAANGGYNSVSPTRSRDNSENGTGRGVLRLTRSVLGTTATRHVNQSERDSAWEFVHHELYFSVRRNYNTVWFSIATTPNLRDLEPRHRGHRL